MDPELTPDEEQIAADAGEGVTVNRTDLYGQHGDDFKTLPRAWQKHIEKLRADFAKSRATNKAKIATLEAKLAESAPPAAEDEESAEDDGTFVLTVPDVEAAIERGIERLGLLPSKGGPGSGGLSPSEFRPADQADRARATLDAVHDNRRGQTEYEKLTPKQQQEILARAKRGGL